MVTGYDKQGPHIYFSDSSQNLIPVNCLSIGSGSRYALAILESETDLFNISDDKAYSIAKRAIKVAANRDAASGGCRN
ncbi:MAG: hypothetical protein MHPSP_003343, partial [Paramarteilia canceri]